MNKYLIEQKIKTLSCLHIGLNYNSGQFPKMIIDDYIFTQWDFNIAQGCLGDAWLVKKEVEANNCVEALQTFRNILDKIVQRVGFISQCYMDFYKEPFLFYKINDNNDKIFFYKHFQERKGAGLQFNEEELSDYQKLQDFKFPETFKFLQECRNTIGYVPKLILLFSALEALCNKIEIDKDDGSRYITYDKNEMKKILGCQLFNAVFGSDGIRHKLNHGEMVDEAFGKDYVDEIYKSIICYFNTECKTKINNVVRPPRKFQDNYEFINLWLKPKNNFEINLKNCISRFLNKDTNSIEGYEYIFNIDPNQY